MWGAAVKVTCDLRHSFASRQSFFRLWIYTYRLSLMRVVTSVAPKRCRISMLNYAVSAYIYIYIYLAAVREMVTVKLFLFQFFEKYRQ